MASDIGFCCPNADASSSLEVGGEQQVLFDISFKVNSGEFVSIMGPSGSGKSTCMNIVGALDTPTSGTYQLYGRDITNMTDDDLAKIRNEYIGFVFQSYNLVPILNVEENILLPRVVGKKKQVNTA